MDTALVTGAFALGGVAIGGVVNARATYWVERRRQAFEARRTARLFLPRLVRLAVASSEAVEGWTWAQLAEVVESNLSGFWEEFAASIAGPLEWEDWFAVFSAVRAYEKLLAGLPEPRKRITENDAQYLLGLMNQALEANAALTAVAVDGGPRRWLRRAALRNLLRRVRRYNNAALVTEVGVTEVEVTEVEAADENEPEGRHR